MNNKRQINGQQFNIPQLVDEALAAVENQTLDLESARCSLAYLGHRNPDEQIVIRYARAIVERHIEDVLQAMFPFGAGQAPRHRVEHSLREVAQVAWREAETSALLNLKTITDVAEHYGISERRARAIAAERHERFGVGYQVPGTNAWLFRAAELENMAPGPQGYPKGRPRKHKEQGTMNDYRVFPAVIYRTPDGWGETTWADAGTMTNTVDDLKSAGDDYQNISLDDCDMFSALTERGAYATYRRMGVRYDEFWVIERNAIAGDGYYQPARVGSRVAQYSSLSDLYDDFPAA